MRTFLIFCVSMLSLLTCSSCIPTPVPQPLEIELHWQSRITGSTPKTNEEKADFAKLQLEVKTTLKLVKDLVRRAHKDKDPEAIKIIRELGNSKASISTISRFIAFFERYTLRVYEFNFSNTGDKKKTLAHISGGSFSDRMSISEKFWTSSIEDQVGTIFHEVSHRAGTVDWWKESKNGDVEPMQQVPTDQKESKGRLMGYRHKSYWKIYEKSGAKFIYNADFWYTFAIFVRRMHDGHAGDDRYPPSVRKSHPVMGQHLTAPQLHSAPTEPEPTSDNDGFDGVIQGEEQHAFYNHDPIPLQPEDEHTVPGPSVINHGATSDSSVPGSPVSISSQDSDAFSNPPSPEPAIQEPFTAQEKGKSAKSSSKGKKGKKKESALTNFMLGGSSRKRRK